MHLSAINHLNALKLTVKLVPPEPCNIGPMMKHGFVTASSNFSLAADKPKLIHVF